MVDSASLQQLELASCVTMPDASMGQTCKKGDTLLIDHSRRAPEDLTGRVAVARTANGNGIAVGWVKRAGDSYVLSADDPQSGLLPISTEDNVLGEVVLVISEPKRPD